MDAKCDRNSLLGDMELESQDMDDGQSEGLERTVTSPSSAAPGLKRKTNGSTKSGSGVGMDLAVNLPKVRW